jgi:hypothetical protein
MLPGDIALARGPSLKAPGSTSEPGSSRLTRLAPLDVICAVTFN